MQIGNDPNYPMMGPTDGAPTVEFHELWIKGEEDYATLQIVNPDILITRFKTSNLMGIERVQPYRVDPAEPDDRLHLGAERVDRPDRAAVLSGVDV